MLKRLLLPLVLLVVLASFFPCPAIPEERGGEVILDVADLKAFLNTLPADEQDEQLRDWASYGLRRSLGSGGSGVPVRHRAVKKPGEMEVGVGRVVPVSAREWALLLPPELAGNRPVIGGLVDRRHATTGTLPERITLYTYSYHPEAATIGIQRQESVPTMRLFTSDYGYRAVAVRTAAELRAFVAGIDDLVSAEWGGYGIILGGRKYGGAASRAPGVEEIATLYQACCGGVNSRQGYEAFVRQRYREMLARDAGLRHRLRRGATTEQRVLAGIRKRHPFRGEEAQLGFSLDPSHDIAGLAGDLERFSREMDAVARGHGGKFSATGSAAAVREVGQVAARLRSSGTIAPLTALRRRLEKENDPQAGHLSRWLRRLEQENSYQAARYDGDLQGTQLGMVLFYTDLLAKLWALDYQGIAPRGEIRGFRTMADIPVPRHRWEEFSRLSSTRLWFGLQQDGFEIRGKRLLFRPVATRVFAASSDPLYPGKESAPNFQSGVFLGWWDRHYDAVAGYEPYYHRLNQIQKWGCLFMVLREENSSGLDFLLQEPVNRSLDFQQWVRENGDLHNRIQVPFADRRKYGRSAECLPLLRSKPHLLMGNEYVLSGGVSLASRREILAKLHRHRASVVDDGADAPPVAKKPAAGAAAGKVRHRGKSGKAAAPQPPPGDDGRQIGFAAERHDGSIKLTWRRSAPVAAQDLVDRLAAQQHSGSDTVENLFRSLGGVGKVVRLAREKRYLVETPGGDWVSLEVNPGWREGDFPAVASGAFPEADIFAARVVPAAKARKLAVTGAVVPVD